MEGRRGGQRGSEADEGGGLEKYHTHEEGGEGKNHPLSPLRRPLGERRGGRKGRISQVRSITTHSGVEDVKEGAE
jgi:hypothetical protein